MKKILKYFLIVVVLILIVAGSIFYFKKNYSEVTVYINDIDTVKIYNVRNGKTMKELDNPFMDGYAFIGWYYLDSDQKFDFSKEITEDITIVAKWAKINIEEIDKK